LAIFIYWPKDAFLLAFSTGWDSISIKGSEVSDNSGRFGDKGVSTADSYPPALLDYASTTSLDQWNNTLFWIHGGKRFSTACFNTLWMFNSSNHQWTWIAGGKTPQFEEGTLPALYVIHLESLIRTDRFYYKDRSWNDLLCSHQQPCPLRWALSKQLLQPPSRASNSVN